MRMRIVRGIARGRWRCERGSYSLELALLVPVVLGIILVTIQTGMWFEARQVAQAAAKRGVESGRMLNATAADGAAAAADFLSHFGGSVHGARVSDEGSTSTQVQITVRGSVPTLVPGLSLSIDQHASGPKERWVP